MTLFPLHTPAWLRIVAVGVVTVAALAYGLLLFANLNPAVGGLRLPIGIAAGLAGLPTTAVLGPLHQLLPREAMILQQFPGWQMYCLLMWFAVALNWLVVLPWIYVGASKLLTRSKSK